MIHNLRKSERLRSGGTIELTSGEARICGRLVDVSMGGLAITISPDNLAQIARRKIWLCRVESDDLPAPVAFLVNILRSRRRGYHIELACQIASISERSMALVKAYHTLAMAREGRLPRAA